MLERHPALVRGARAEPLYHEGLYVCNGVGGRGFVFAPMLGEMLAKHLVEGRTIDRRVDPDRLFLKWCRRSPELKR
jgi:tRNA 5-methylaminomethyl-2-thiouridine biosynthesis bifunctional protein